VTNAKRTVDSNRVNLLLREGEGLTVEFKERYTPRIDEDVVAFANAKGGTLLLGVRDGGTVVGERLTNDLKARINDLARNCKPPISVELAQVGEVVAIVVPEGTQKPYSCGSGYYRRLDGNTQKMSHDELRIMFAENDPTPFEERTVRGFTFDDISKAKIRAFIKEAGIRVGRVAVSDFLRSLDVAVENRVKIAGVLFFAKRVFQHIRQAQMTLVAFKGTDKLYIYDRRDVRDDLLTQYHEAIEFLKRHLNIRTEIRGLNRKDIYEIPMEVLREAVVNALMHRDYGIRGTQVSVEIYDDRVEITNPGGLAKGLTLKKFGSMSFRRNDIISDLFSRMHMVERVGSGIRKMRRAMAAAGLLPPEFDLNGFFTVILRRSPEFSLKEKAPLAGEGKPTDPAQTEDKVSALKLALKISVKSALKTASAIIDAMKEDPHITVPEIARTISVSTRTVNNYIRRLKETGFIRRVGPDKGGHWEVVR
jgi:ATP-dependent DNA helicase RecG